ncbi:MAG: antitoxin family protein [Planctomycetota bacterium]
MTTPEVDQRSPGRRASDEQIAAEPQMPPRELPPDAPSSPVEAHLVQHRRRPVAVEGVVENGLVRPLDPAVKLPEHSRVIIVASEES